MTDIVEQARECGPMRTEGTHDISVSVKMASTELVHALADEIERLQAIIESVPVDRWNPWHTVTIRKGSWHMAHPITCVLDDCAFDGLAQAEWDQPPHDVGVWRWHDFDDEPWDWEQEQ